MSWYLIPSLGKSCTILILSFSSIISLFSLYTEPERAWKMFHCLLLAVPSFAAKGVYQAQPAAGRGPLELMFQLQFDDSVFLNSSQNSRNSCIVLSVLGFQTMLLSGP